MKHSLLPALLLISCLNTPAGVFAQQREMYALRIYALSSEVQETNMDAYLKDAFLPAMRRMAISPVGVFKLHPDYMVTANKIYVLIPFSGLEQLKGLDDALLNDKAYLSAAAGFLESGHETPPYSRFETVVMEAFEGMPKLAKPQLDGARGERVYELRSYESASEAYSRNKVAMFNEGGEIPLFEKLGFNAIFYARVLAGSHMPNLMYLTSFSDMGSRDAHWEAFFKSAKWKELSTMPQYQNNVSHADILLLYPTSYSDY